jgi:hypothetical protein
VSTHLGGSKLIVFLPWNQMSKKSYIFISYDVMLKYVCAKKIVCHSVLKITNIFLKWLKWFLIFMKFVVSTKHCDFIWLEKIYDPCQKLNNYYITR